MPFTLKQMRYALAVAEERHFGRAAERCNVTQSALSQQIRVIEDMCGMQLFDRRSPGVQLTPFGEDFLERARSIVADADALTAFATTQTGKPARPLRFGLIPTVAPYLLPTIYPIMRTALADIDFTISESRTERLLTGLVGGTLDLALIATDPPSSARLTCRPLFTDAFVCAAHRNSAMVEPVHLDTLSGDRILLLDEGHCFRDQAIKACALRGEEAARTFAATSLSTIVELVANGQGITLLPAISLNKEAADPRVHILPLAPPGAARTLSLVWRATTPYGNVFERIAGVIRGEAGEAEFVPAE